MKNSQFSKPDKDGPRINYDIRADEVRLVGVDGEMLGVVSKQEALRQAQEVGLDLIEVSPNAVPPVCKILDYGKYKYEQQKKKHEAKKKQKVVEVKEIKVRLGIGDHDYKVKLGKMKQFFSEGHKVRVTLRFRGREAAHQELGYELMKRIQEALTEYAKAEIEPKMEGNQLAMTLAQVVAKK